MECEHYWQSIQLVFGMQMVIRGFWVGYWGLVTENAELGCWALFWVVWICVYICVYRCCSIIFVSFLFFLYYQPDFGDVLCCYVCFGSVEEAPSWGFWFYSGLGTINPFSATTPKRAKWSRALHTRTLKSTVPRSAHSYYQLNFGDVFCYYVCFSSVEEASSWGLGFILG
jgi:hypothetical protein